MKTPIADFVKQYQEQNKIRLHMPGHKGVSILGCEILDITEVKGADALYEADGIIAESEKNASLLFQTGVTLFSTEGSSQCIRAMLYLAKITQNRKNPVVVAARNVHKAFVYAAALLDLDVVWIYPEEDASSLCSCQITEEILSNALEALDEPPIAVYLTSPDYLGSQLDIKKLAEVCHEYGTLLAVDNAHGAYLHYLEPSSHPMDLGADICCDSAHKTLPVLTGGAYLHISEKAPETLKYSAKQGMALFGSTSPSYLILQSLDLCNKYLANGYKNRLKECTIKIERLKNQLKKQRWVVVDTEPLKLTVEIPAELSGMDLAEQLRFFGIECEFADQDYLVCMFTPELEDEVYQRVGDAFGYNDKIYLAKKPMKPVKTKQLMSIREAVFSAQETIAVEDALGRSCGTPTVSCPPAIPIVVSGEEIEEHAIDILKYYGISTIDVVKEKGD